MLKSCNFINIVTCPRLTRMSRLLYIKYKLKLNVSMINFKKVYNIEVK